MLFRIYVLSEFFYGWLIVAFLFLILEISSPGLLFFLSFFIGAFCTALAALLSLSMTIQLIIFLCVSILSCFLLPLWLRKRVQERTHATNVQAIIGKRGIVIKAIGVNHTGQIKVQGEIWSALSVNNEEIEEGTMVEVVNIRGVHLFVKKI